MSDRAETRQHQLTETLRSSYGHLGINGLHLIGQAARKVAADTDAG